LLPDHGYHAPSAACAARSLHDALPILVDLGIAKLHFELGAHGGAWTWGDGGVFHKAAEEKSCGAVIWRMSEGRREYLLARHNGRSEEHTSELQSRFDLVCRLLLENNNK